MKKNVVLVLLIISVGFSYLYAEEEKKSIPWGFIFNTSNLLLDIDSYQAGVGIKALYDNNIAIRYLGDIFYSNSSNAFSTTLGAAFEKHFRKGRISPYWGGFIEAGYIGQETIEDVNNWTKNKLFPLSIGGILGVEVFLLEYISVFAEYKLSLKGTISLESSSTFGNVTKNEAVFNYSIDSGIGNNSSIGIVIYLDNIINFETPEIK